MGQQMFAGGMDPNNAGGPPPGAPAGPGSLNIPSQPRAASQPSAVGPQPGGFRGRPNISARGAGRGAGFPSRGRALPIRPSSPLPPNVPTGPRNKNKYRDIDGSAPAVEGLDYGGGGGTKEPGRGTPPEYEERSSRKRRNSPSVDDGRGSKRR